MSTTSSLPRKPPTTALSNGHLRLTFGVVAALASVGCPVRNREPLLTYLNGPQRLSVRYRDGWQITHAEQGGFWYRSFVGPPAPPGNKPAVSVTLLSGPLDRPLDEFARDVYLTDNQVLSSRDEERPWGRGKSWRFQSPGGATRHSLLLLTEAQRVVGLYSQGEAGQFERNLASIEEMEKSLAIERPDLWPERSDTNQGYRIRLPASWRETRRFAGGQSLLVQFTSPPLKADSDGQTVHAALTLTIEKIDGTGDVDAFYNATLKKFGESFAIRSHDRWRGGYVDSMRTETPVAVSHVRRYYLARDGRGYSLAFESRDDVTQRAEPWFDLIASTFELGSATMPR